MAEIDDDDIKLGTAVAALNDPEWLKKNGPALVAEAAKTNVLLRLHMAGALTPLLQAAKEFYGEDE